MLSKKPSAFTLLVLFAGIGWASVLLPLRSDRGEAPAPVPTNNFNFFNVQDYYQKGDADYTKAFQRCFDAVAQGSGSRKVIVPAKSDGYKISSTIRLQKGGKSKNNPHTYVIVEGPGKGSPIHYTGPAGSSIFQLTSMPYSEWSNLEVSVNNHQVIPFDCRTPDGTIGGFTNFHRVLIHFQTFNNGIGWRLGWDSVTNGNFPSIQFEQCLVDHNSANLYNGCVAWQVCGQNAYPAYYINCQVNQCHSMIWSGPLLCTLSSDIKPTQTTIPVYNSFLLPQSGSCKITNSNEVFTYTGNTRAVKGELTGVTRGPGARAVRAGGTVAQNLTEPAWGVVPGCSQQYIVGGAAAQLQECFAFIRPNTFSIRDFNYEAQGSIPSRYLRLGDAHLTGGNTKTMFNVTVQGGRISRCALPGDGQAICRMAGNANLHFGGVHIIGPKGNTAYSSPALPFVSQLVSGAKTFVSYEDCFIQASRPFNNLQGATPHFKRTALKNASSDVSTIIP